MYNRKRRQHQIEKVTEIDEDKFPDVLKNEKKELDTRLVLFELKVDLDSFLYSITKHRYEFLKIEAEQVLGREYRNWSPEERKDFLWKIRYEATLIDSYSPSPEQFDQFPDEVLTELEKSYARRRKLSKTTLQDLEKMKRENDRK